MIKQNKSIVVDMSVKVVIIIGISFLIGLFFLNPWAYAKGLALGGLFTILKIKLMHTTFSKAIKKQSVAAIRYAKLHYALRYFLTLVVIVIGALDPSIHIIGVIVGLISLKLAAYWQGLMEKPTPKDGSIQFLKWEDDNEEKSDF